MLCIYCSDPDVIAITECWLKPHILPTGYAISRNDRHSCGDGVMIAVKKKSIVAI